MAPFVAVPEKYSGGLTMKLTPHAGSVANRSGDRRNISASLTEKNCPNLRRFHGAPFPAFAFPQNPRFFPRRPRVFHGNPRTFHRIPRAFPRRAVGSAQIPAISAVVPSFPRKSQAFPPPCEPFPRNPSHFPRTAGCSRQFPRRFISTSYQFKGRNGRGSGTGFQPVTDSERLGKNIPMRNRAADRQDACPTNNPRQITTEQPNK
jgi:hypothetical protein